MSTELQIAIYVVDDDECQRFAIDAIFKSKGINNYSIFQTPDELMQALHDGVQICLLDYELRAAENGYELMQRVLLQNSYCKCIIMSAHRDFHMVKDFLNAGAFRYLEKGEADYSQLLVTYVKEALQLVKTTYNFYSTMRDRMNETKNLLKNVRNGNGDY